MAQSIKEPPVLTGKDAVRFEKQIKENESGKNKLSTEDYARAHETYNRIVVK